MTAWLGRLDKYGKLLSFLSFTNLPFPNGLEAQGVALSFVRGSNVPENGHVVVCQAHGNGYTATVRCLCSP